jgi:membrane protein
MRLNAIWQTIPNMARAAVVGFLNDGAISHAAAMAFYAATSLAPVLLIVIAIAGLVVGHEAAELAVSAQLAGLLGPQGADLIAAIVQGAADTDTGVFASIIAVVTLVASASGVFGEMQTSLNQIWKVEPQSFTVSTLIRARAASLGLVAALGFLLLVSLVASAAISGLGEVINRLLPFGTWVLSIINMIVSVGLIALLFGGIYKVLPDRTLAWRDVRFAALITAVLFTIGKSLIGWYLGTSAVASSYGAAGSLIVLLLWVFYSSAIFLFGAEIARAFATTWGSRQDLAGKVPQTQSEQTQSQEEGVDSERPGRLAIAAISFISVASAAVTQIALMRRRNTIKK